MSGSCPVGADVCREAHAEVVNLRNHVRALTEDVARADTLAKILDGAREGLARSGSRAKGVRDVQALLTASAVREGVEAARRRVLSTRRREDRGRAASNALSLLRERDEARAEVERLRAGIEHLTRVGYSHTPDCEPERKRARLDRHPDCGRCWEDSLHDLLNPTEGEAP